MTNEQRKHVDDKQRCQPPEVTDTERTLYKTNTEYTSPGTCRTVTMGRGGPLCKSMHFKNGNKYTADCTQSNYTDNSEHNEFNLRAMEKYLKNSEVIRN